jgi:tetratricopeptide (TPR) repeat protein
MTALEECRNALELDPSFIPAQTLLAGVLARLGRHDDAITQAQKCLSLPGYELRGRGTLGRVYAIAGRKEEARKIASELETQQKPDRLASMLSNIHALLGDREKALQWLEEAYRERVSYLVFIGQTPEFESLHGDPRFEELLRRIGLPGTIEQHRPTSKDLRRKEHSPAEDP